MLCNVLNLNTNKTDLITVASKMLLRKVDVDGLLLMPIVGSQEPGCYSGLQPLIAVTHQVHHPVCFLPCQQHFQTSVIILRLCYKPLSMPLSPPIRTTVMVSCVGNPANSGQILVCAELSCQGSHSHRAQAQYCFPHVSSFVTIQLSYHLRTPRPHRHIPSHCCHLESIRPF